MNYFTLLVLLFLSSCASKEKKYQELENKLDKLTKLMENQQKMTKDKIEEKENIEEEKTAPISLPIVQNQLSDENRKKVKLGEKNGNSFDFLFNNSGSYWVNISPYIAPYSELELRIHGLEHENPETISLVRINENTFQGIGDRRVGITNLELHYRVQKKETIIINFDLNFKE
jgi:hypothetical protein